MRLGAIFSKTAPKRKLSSDLPIALLVNQLTGFQSNPLAQLKETLNDYYLTWQAGPPSCLYFSLAYEAGPYSWFESGLPPASGVHGTACGGAEQSPCT
ncbi:hypothetical protein EFA69_14140 [Rufibacter immobilis]|uniref:Alpha-carbonic anhydrase domain-containing protein n=1 Tax=Rufibacter immobilis TaxID=1348778 RepID=A0A3M9MPY6_9BACT|nr:hypothetical protein EFA69_14140 [Rufibacter immobilis]